MNHYVSTAKFSISFLHSHFWGIKKENCPLIPLLVSVPVYTGGVHPLIPQ
jgi:hypothetical protein